MVSRKLLKKDILFGQEAGYEGLTSLSVMVATCCAFVTINIALLLLI